MFYKFLKEVHPEENSILRSYSEGKDLLVIVDLPIVTIHACVKNCILYRGEIHGYLTCCPNCLEEWFYTNAFGQRSPKKVCFNFLDEFI
jgi:hypothetical protein